MLDEEKDDWCIVRYKDGDMLIRREYQWAPQANNYRGNWEYMAKGLSWEQANKFVVLFKEQ